MAAGRAALSFAVLLGMSGVLANCILVLPPIEHGEHCQFEGTTVCASCLRTSCQASIDACCDDISCRGYSDGDSAVLAGLDACGRGDTTACASAMNGATYGNARGIASCVATSCKDECVGDAKVSTPSPSWSCTAPRTQKAECATCIYTSCSTTLTNCCGDSSCSSTGGDFPELMGACTSGDGPSCLYYLASSTYGGRGTSAGTLGAFEGCIAEKCSESCFPDGGRMHNTCSLGDYGKSCRCHVSATSSGVDCSVEAVGGTCVLGISGCSCGTYGCDVGSSAARCSCGFGGYGTSTSCYAADTSDHCCLKFYADSVSCECRSWSCSQTSDEYDIESCSEETVLSRLKTSKRIQDTCSN